MGLRGILVQLSDRLDDAANRRALALAARIEAEVGAAAETGALAGVEEVAPSLGSVFLQIDPLRADRAAIAGRIAALLADAAGQGAAPSRRWTIPVAFGGAGGPDLDAVAAELGCTAQAAVDDLTAQDLRVMAIGFAPGLPYMGILPGRWDIPRKAGLTPKVPAGDCRGRPAGDPVPRRHAHRLVACRPVGPARLPPRRGGPLRLSRGRQHPPAGGGTGPVAGASRGRSTVAARGLSGVMTRALLIHRAGPAMTVQDLGRPGYLARGLSRGGAADRLALRQGAALLGQAAGRRWRWRALAAVSPSPRRPGSP
ncbi:MAG: carboxyltransferase domain-containing protein [Defluviimonas denitrificans]